MPPEVLKKPLIVKFMGEEGIDQGGVKKEFFTEVISRLFNPDYGLFEYITSLIHSCFTLLLFDLLFYFSNFSHACHAVAI